MAIYVLKLPEHIASVRHCTYLVNEKNVFLKKYAIGFTRDRTRDILVTRVKPGLSGMILKKVVELDKTNSCYFNLEFIL